MLHDSNYMSEIINEKVSVVSVYERTEGKVMPCKIKWQDKVYKVKQVGLHYPVRQGRKLLHYFSVVTENNTSFKLRLDTENLHWTLEEVIDEFTF
jgi:hypothetical protein